MSVNFFKIFTLYVRDEECVPHCWFQIVPTQLECCVEKDVKTATSGKTSVVD